MESPQPRDEAIRQGDPPLAPRPSEPLSDIEVVPGDASKDRFFALVFDNFIGLVLGIVAAGAIPNDQVVLRGTTWAPVSLGISFLFEPLFRIFPLKTRSCAW